MNAVNQAVTRSDDDIEPRLHVSAFIDGELDDAVIDRVIDSLLASDELATFWADAHRAGDWMRSEEVTGVGDGAAFLREFSARLAGEPAIVAPRLGNAAGRASRSRRFWVRTGLPGASVAAALVVVAWVATPLGGGARSTATPSIAVVQAPSTDVGSIRAVEYRTVDPERLSDYLAAHRDVTPFAYRGGAIARPASFTASAAPTTP